ncbi:ribonuclease R [Halosquirtibacter xylanolyticus]|uniref:ribonuclease R n=1 Tax=Halosquirtibacter xylanolyticus TaxID=3374599 RepID=UPI00374A458E|nr:ribonuclease R [Prolixibacteraceae bacterium]
MGNKRNKVKKGRKKLFTKKDIKKSIIKIFQENVSRSYNNKQLASILGVKDMPTKQLITVVLFELEDQKMIIQESRGKYKLDANAGYVNGTIKIASKGNGILTTDDVTEPILILSHHMNRALPGDKVKVLLHAKRKNKEQTGEVVEILDRNEKPMVGIIQRSKHFNFFIPNQKMSFDIFIPKDKLLRAEDGQRALVRITDWPTHAKNPFGEVVEVLGDVGDHKAEMNAIIAEYELPTAFPPRVESYAEGIVDGITEEEVAKRWDFREVTTFTIDPKDAKDFDDALSIKKLENGNWQIGVHIADVTHYVRPKTLLEEEAYERATSVYLVDRVVPMLPEHLSNGVCSLRPNEDKLCFSAVFELNNDAEIQKQWFGRTVIHSDRRFAYEEAQEIIEGADGDFKQEILTLDRLAKELRADRFNNGSIGFDRVEVKFNLDEHGRPTGVYFKESKDANKLIEEFMLLANKRVAEFIGKQPAGKKAKTFVYRIHDKPDPERLENFNRFIQRFGYGIQTTSPKNIALSMNKLLGHVDGKSEQNVIETLAIRTMAKAEYSTHNIGHYGLHFDYYSHFTSPIRRYPDMMVHRLLARYLDGGRSVMESKYEGMCQHASKREQRAANAERASIKYKQVEFMVDKIGAIFEGSISGVTEWGIYVELDENKCEGMIPLSMLKDDYYQFDEKNYCIIGKAFKNKYQMGDKLQVRIAKANLQKKQLDFELA